MIQSQIGSHEQRQVSKRIQPLGYNQLYAEDQIFCRAQWGWDIFVHSARGKYCISALTAATRPVSATKLVTLSHRNTLVVSERPLSWDWVQLDLDPNEYNPLDDPPPCVNSLFGAFVQNPRTLLDKCKLPTDGGAAIAQALTTGTVAAVSDGFYDDSRQAGSSAFIIAPSKDKGAVCLKGVNFVIGLPEEQSSYRSDLAGVLGVLTCVEALVKFYNIQNDLITIALDGESAIYQSDSEWPLSIGQNSFDYIQVIRNIIKALPLTVKFHWVEGHQNEKGLTMDWWAQKNDYVDGKAREFL